MPPLSPFSLARQFRPASERKKQNERQPKRTNSFCTCLTFHCSAAGAARCQIGKGQSARVWSRGGRGVRKIGMCAQGCHQWQQPSNVARKPTRCSIHFRFGLASISLSIYPPSDRSGVCSNWQSIWQLRGIWNPHLSFTLIIARAKRAAKTQVCVAYVFSNHFWKLLAAL